MSFDENPPSPDKIIEPKKATTKVNFAIVGGVLTFFMIGILAIWLVARR